MWERTLSQKLVRLFCEQKVIDEAKTDAYVALEQGHLHYGNGSRSLEREQHLWLYGISAGCPGIA